MARELELNPRKLSKLANHRQESWKAPMPQFIEYLYSKRFGRERPQTVVPAEQWARSAAGRRRRVTLRPRRTPVASAEGGLT
jgi:hypothetical protein